MFASVAGQAALSFRPFAPSRPYPPTPKQLQKGKPAEDLTNGTAGMLFLAGSFVGVSSFNDVQNPEAPFVLHLSLCIRFFLNFFSHILAFW